MKLNENLVKNFLENIDSEHESIRHLKLAAISCKQFELAANIREIEKELFPETEEQKLAKETGEAVSLALNMTGIQRLDGKLAWIINETIKSHLKLKGKFSLKDAESIKSKAEKLFPKQI